MRQILELCYSLCDLFTKSLASKCKQNTYVASNAPKTQINVNRHC